MGLFSPPMQGSDMAYSPNDESGDRLSKKMKQNTLK